MSEGVRPVTATYWVRSIGFASPDFSGFAFIAFSLFTFRLQWDYAMSIETLCCKECLFCTRVRAS